MKKNLHILTLALLFASVVGLAQGKKNNATNTSSSTGAKCFDENSHVLNIGIGFGGGRYYRYGNLIGYSYRSSPAFSLTYEQAIKKRLGPGFLGVGAYFGYQTAHFQYDNYFYNGNNYYYRHTWNYMLIAARGAYHLDILNTDKAELYFGGIIGLRFQTYKFESNSPDPNKNYYELSNRSIYPTGSLFIGGRWYFVPKVALFAEVGYGISYLTAGISLKF